MKKTCLLFLIIWSNLVIGQKVSLGPELGLNIVPLENTNYGYNYQMGFHAGLQIKYKLSDHFSLVSGLSLTQKKKKYAQKDTSSIFEYFGSALKFAGIDEEELDSIAQSFGANTNVLESTDGVVAEMLIEIPLMVNYTYKNFNVYAGPYFGLLINANFKEETQTQIPLLDVLDISQFDSTGLASAFLPDADETSSSSNSSTDGLNKLDIGVNLGIGYQMNQLHFNLFYSKGFLDYTNGGDSIKKEFDKDGKETTEREIESSTLSTFRFSLVYFFELKAKEANSPRLE